MRLKPKKPITPPDPNTLIYDLSVASRIQAGQLVLTVGLILKPVNYEEKHGVGTYTETYTSLPPTVRMIPDLGQLGQGDADLVAKVTAAWEAWDALVEALNEKEKLL